MQVQAINNRGKYNYQQNQNYNKKVNPSFTALKGVDYGGDFSPRLSLDHAKMVKGLLDNPAFQRFCTKYDVRVEFYIKNFLENNHISLYLYCKEALKDNKPNNMIQKFKNFFKAVKKDERDEYKLFFNSQFDKFNTLSETELEKEINYAKERLISRKQEAEKCAEILKSVEEAL